MSDLKINDAAKRADEILAELRRREAASAEVRPLEAFKKARGKKKPQAAEAKRKYLERDTDALIRELRANQKVVYGADDRMDIHQVSDENVQRNASSVVSLIDVASIVDNGNGTSLVQTVRFGDAQRLCSSERFVDQRTAPFCSGFLVAPNLVATAGHCINNNNLARTRFVFGYRVDNFTDGTIRLPNSEIFAGEAIVAWDLVSDGADYAVVRLDRPAIGKPIARLQRDAKIADNEGVYVIGHPSGLPMKYAPDAVVRDNSRRDFFTANLDTYGGNSGSAVFNAETHEVEGILVRGETDFVNAGTCRVSNVCPTTGCRGEDITRTSVFADFVPKAAPPPAASTLEGRVAQLETSIADIAAMVKRIEDKLP
ncbi:MAG: serine protease [Pseudomonadota bacterium]